MSRWEPGTADKLRLAALELFVERGYDATTVDDIVEQVGVTQRTFFRHFADKEEVLFDEDASMQQVLLDGAQTYLRRHGPRNGLAAARAATAALARSFEAERERHRARRQVLADVPALQGRQLVKQERWGEALRDTLAQNGVPPVDASVAVAVAVAALQLAYSEWLTANRSRRLHSLLMAADARLDSVLTPARAERDVSRTGRNR